MAALARAAQQETTGDLGSLYGQLSKRVQQIVRLGVRAPDPVIEDACQVAWIRLIDRRDRVGGTTTLPWLVKTAKHEAFKLIQRDGRERSLEATLATSGEGALCLASPGADELAVAHERLAQLERLPPRQQRLMWLHGFGFSYTEMARHTGDTPRTVERQLLRAKHAARGFEL